MVYQPMLRDCLPTCVATAASTPFLVSGGGVEFIRVWAEALYGIPPEQVIGSAGKMKFEVQRRHAGARSSYPRSIDRDKEGKPVGIQNRIGRRPIAAFGNSDGDLDAAIGNGGSGARFALFVHHDDAARASRYDREDKLQQFDKVGTRQSPGLNRRQHEARLEGSSMHPKSHRDQRRHWLQLSINPTNVEPQRTRRITKAIVSSGQIASGILRELCYSAVAQNLISESE